ncbi:MAG: hypothetical protein JXB50_12635 [Spirochaetes bacterium]|nr:hypothetical protein [Spirochaetota bacterium]
MKKKIIILEIITLFFILIIISTSIIILNFSIFNFFIEFKEVFLNEIEITTGYKINYSKISPNILGKINIFEVEIYNQNSSRLELGNIEIDYSLLNFLFNRKTPLSIIKKISFKSFNLKINNDNDLNEIKNNFLNNNNSKNSSTHKIKKLIIEISKGKITLNKNLNSCIINIETFKANIKDKITINSKLSFSYFKKNKLILNTKINNSGYISFYKTFNASNFNINLYNISYLNNFFKDQNFIFNSINKNFILYRINDYLPFEFNLLKFENNLICKININDLITNSLITSENKSFFIPDNLTLNFYFRKNLNNQIKNAFFKMNSYYESLLFLKNISISLDTKLQDESLHFNKLLITNKKDNSYIFLTGILPFYDSDFNLVLDINNFIFPKTTLDTKIYLTKNNNIINLLSDDILLNNQNLSNFFYQFQQYNDGITLRTIKSFNGYMVNGTFVKNNKNYDYNIEHYFNSFLFSKIINAYKNQNDVLVLNGKIIQKMQNNELEIKKSYVEIIKNQNEIIYDFFISLKDNIFYLDNSRQNNLKFNSWINFSSTPVLSSINIDNNKSNYAIYSKLSDNNFQLSLNENLIINYVFNDKKIYFNSKDFLIKLNKIYSKLNFNFIYNIANGNIQENTIQINQLSLFKNQMGNLKLKMAMIKNEVKFYDIIYYDKINLIKGDLNAKYNIVNKNFIINGFLKDDEKDESYAVDFNLNGLNVKSNIYITHLNISKILSNKNISGNLNLRLKIEGFLLNPDLELQLELEKGKYKNKNMEFLLAFKKNNEEILINRAFIKLKNNFITISNSKIILTNKENYIMSANGSLSFLGLDKNLRANFILAGNFDAKNILKNFRINFNFNKIQLGYLSKNELVKQDKLEINPFTINIIKNNDQLEISDYDKKYIHFIKNNKNYELKIKDNNIEVLNSIFQINNNNLNGTFNFKKFPVNYIENILIPYVGINNGLIDGEILLTGLINKPSFKGKLNVYYGRVLLPQYLQAPIDNITGFILAEGNQFLVRNVNGDVKKGLAHGYGEVILNGWKLERYSFHINSDNVPAKINQDPVDAIGIGYIEDFLIEGKPQSYNFIGNLVIENADINLKAAMGADKNVKIKKLPINVIMTFKSGNRVNVNYPIFKGTLKPGQVFVLKFIGDEAQIYLGGTVGLEKGEVNYLNKIFKIEQATFQFYEDEYKINPMINLKSFYKTKDLSKNPIKIYLSINDRLFPFKTNFSSFPAKSQEEINNLLGLTYALSDNDSNNNTNFNAIANTTDYIGNSLIITPIENKIRKITKLDTFSLDTKIFGNIIKYNTEDNTNSFDLLDESSVTLGKYLFNQLYFESMLSFNKRKTINQQLFLPFNDQNYGLNLQLMLQLELQYLSIGYTYIPKNYTNFFNADHMISLEANFRL